MESEHDEFNNCDRSKSQGLQLFTILKSLQKNWFSLENFETISTSGELSNSLLMTLFAINKELTKQSFENSFGKRNNDSDDQIKNTKNSAKQGISISRLADFTNHSLPYTSQKVRLLEERGFIERFNSPTDRRVFLIKLTDSGEKLVLDSANHIINKALLVLDNFGKKNTEDLIYLLDKLNNTLLQYQEESAKKQL